MVAYVNAVLSDPNYSSLYLEICSCLSFYTVRILYEGKEQSTFFARRKGTFV